jgi:hypothetical protein
MKKVVQEAAAVVVLETTRALVETEVTEVELEAERVAKEVGEVR